MQDLFLGIDLGGTGMRAAIYDASGVLVITYEDISFKSSPDNKLLADNLELIIRRASITKAADKGQIVVWGLASPGPLDPHKGIIECPPNLKVKNFGVVSHLQKKFPDLRGYLLNDADAALLGEYQWGVAKGFKHVIGIFAGTGLGTACISNYKLQRGLGKGGGWGHNTIYGLGENRKCVCGNINCWEAFCGTQGLAKTYRKIFKTRSELTREQVFQISRDLRSDLDDSRVKTVFALYASHFCEGLINMVCAYHPECIVLGGGIIKGNDLLLQYINKRINIAKRKLLSGALLEGVVVKLAQAEVPGLLGAAAYAMQNYERYKFELTGSV